MAGERSLPGLGLKGFWTPGTNGWSGPNGMDGNLRTLSAVAQLTVLSRTTALPNNPADGALYIVPHPDNRVALRDNGAWVYLTPNEGWQAWVSSENKTYVFDGTAWIIETEAGIEEAPEDNTGYVRKNAAWVPETIGGGGEGDALLIQATSTGPSGYYSAQPHKRWRIVVTETYGNPSCMLAEVQFRSVPGVSQLVGPGIAFHNSELEGAIGAQAFDNNPSTYWHTAGVTPGIVGYTFDTAIEVREVSLTLRNHSAGLEGGPRHFLVEWADNGDQWQTAWEVTEAGFTAPGQTLVFTDPNAGEEIHHYPAAIGALNDVDMSTPPADGQALVWDALSSAWVPGDVEAVSGGAGGSGGGVLKNFAPPRVSDFPLLSLKSGMTLDMADGDAGLALTVSPRSGAGINNVFAGRAVADPVFEAKMRLKSNFYNAVSGNPFLAGLAVRNATTGKLVGLHIASLDTGFALEVVNWNGLTSFQNVLFTTGNHVRNKISDTLWFKVASDGTNLTFSYSANGELWLALATSVVANFIGSIDEVGFFSDNESPTPGSVLIDWYSDSSLEPRYPMVGGGSASAPYDIGTYAAGKPAAGERLIGHVVPRPFTLPADLAGSQARALTASVAQATFTLSKNGTAVGSIVFAAAGTVATFQFEDAVTFAAGDMLTLDAPGEVDATLADIAITLVGER